MQTVLSIHLGKPAAALHRTAWRREITYHISLITPARARAQLLRFRLLSHLLRGHFGNFHERELQAAEDFDKQIVIRRRPDAILPAAAPAVNMAVFHGPGEAKKATDPLCSGASCLLLARGKWPGFIVFSHIFGYSIMREQKDCKHVP